jgi:NAD(P)-dependent dehydrogenase (short-subunit alcohol dehydrogenase family)
MTKSVLISGASSGIGKELSLELDRHGYAVFAGLRTAEDAEELRSQATQTLTPVMLDITNPDIIAAACGEVRQKTGGLLDCLVNNAGISISGAIEFIPIDDFRQQLEVNLVGQLALTQSCLPLIRNSNGRIIFISSVAGRLVTPFNGPYSASKAALVAMADALRLELAPWKLPVSVMIVGSVQTPIWEKSAQIAGDIVRRLPREAWVQYGKAQKKAGMFYQRTGKNGLPVEKVAQQIHRVIEQPNPKAYVLVGRNALAFELAAKIMPVRWRDWLVRRKMGLLEDS